VREKQGGESKWLLIMESTVPALPKVLTNENRINVIYAEVNKIKTSKINATVSILGWINYAN